MFTKLIRNPLFFFVVKAAGLFLVWLFVYKLWIHSEGWLDGAVINNLIYLSGKLLTLFGYETFHSTGDIIRTIGIDGSHGVWVGDPCNGIDLFALFAGFVIAYPGPVKKKLWFIPLGLIAIHLLNTIRVTALAMIAYHSPESLDFNHTYTFTILVYGFIFYLWMLWANKLSKSTLQKQTISR